MTVTAIVALSDVKEHCKITTATHDTQLAGFITAADIVVEGIVGPVIETTVDEWYPGGSPVLVLRTRPVISVTSVTEYWGLTSYTLTHAATPSAATTYSYTFDARGWLVRRSAGGMERAFGGGTDSVHVVYEVGRTSVPGNIRLGELELIRHWYQQTQQGGRPALTGAAAYEDTTVVSSGYAIPNRVLEMLQVKHRAPAIG